MRSCVLPGVAALALAALLALAPAEAAPAGRSLLRVDTRFLDAPGQEEYPGASAIILEDDIRFELLEDGSTVYYEHDAIKLLTQEGVERYGSSLRTYRKGYEEIEFRVARTIQADGRVVDVSPGQMEDRPLIEGSGLYGEYRQLAFEFPEAVPGSVVEFEVVTRRAARPGRQWWALSYVQNPDPMLVSRFTVSVPAQTQVYRYAPGVIPSTPEVHRQGDRVLQSWLVKDSPALPVEPMMPDSAALLSRVEVSSFPDWKAYGSWFYRLWRQAVQADERVRITTSGLLPTGASTEAKIAAIVGWLAQNKEVNQSVPEQLRPHDAPQSLQARVLTPLDMSVLLAAMLRYAGVEASPVLVSNQTREDLARQLPQPEHVPRLLLVVPGPGGSRRWLDPANLGELSDWPPAGAQKMGALLMDEGVVELIETPEAPAERNRRDIWLEGRVDSGGTAEVGMMMTLQGSSAALWKQASLALGQTSAAQREGLLERLFGQIAAGFPGRARIYDYYFPVPGQTTPGRPFSLAATLTLSDLVSGGEKATRLPLPLYGGGRLEGLAQSRPPRRFPVKLDFPYYDEMRLHLVFPEGSRLSSAPLNVEV
ncbi:MAG TPA: DUF3857 domain-containing protein, partial [Candidatus Nitrosotenuis sp.]|nr:DUF3857 domain-containing protein [Candidatus Nitrosotenuis sp.]